VEAIALDESDDDESKPMAAERPSVVTEAEGLRLHLSATNRSGYTGVYQVARGGTYTARYVRGNPNIQGNQSILGTFDTAIDAAVAYARFAVTVQEEDKSDVGPAESAGLPAEVDGHVLELSSNASSGYKGVYLSETSGQFVAVVTKSRDAEAKYIGVFPSILEAATARAKFLAQPREARPLLQLSTRSSKRGREEEVDVVHTDSSILVRAFRAGNSAISRGNIGAISTGLD
jgi:hypothetical protein